MANYQNGTIYKIVCKDKSITDCYVGSTTSHSKRKSAHKSKCNNKNDKHYNYPVYRFIRDNGGIDNWEFVLLEDYPCRNKKQLNIRERFWFEKLNATLNDRYPERGEEEKKEYHKNYSEEYYEENKEEILEKAKEYYEENKEKFSERNEKYRQKNKEKLNEKAKEKVECPCGSIINRSNLPTHKKSQKHQNWEKNQTE